MRPLFLRWRSWAVGSLAGLATVGTAAVSNAQQAKWHDGAFQYIEGLACVVWIPETTVTTFAGYWATDDASYPATGDVTYIRAAAGIVGNPCAGGDTIGFEFFPPSDTELATSESTPVRCIATNLTTGESTSVDPNIHCLQTPEVGASGGAFFGFATLPSGWMFEVRVPVRFLRRLAGGASQADQLRVLTSTAEGSVLASLSPFVSYRPSIGYLTPSVTAGGDNSYELHSYVYSYNQGGTFSVDLTNQSGNYVGGIIDHGPYVIADGQVANGVTTPITFLPEVTGAVYWRAKYTTIYGTFYGAEQVFQANDSTPSAYTLTVSRTGAGAGNVHTETLDIDCGETCSAAYTAGSPVTLTAVADPGSTFVGWSGACSGAEACVVTMSADQAVTAQFGVAEGVSYGGLSFAVEGLPDGPSGTMHVNGPSLTDHTVSLPSGIGQNLSDVSPGAYTANVDPVTWEGQTYLPRPVNVSTVVVAGGTGELTARYAVARDVSLSVTGAGHVESSPAGIDCMSHCVGQFADGDVVELTAEPDDGWVFVGWTGACSGQGVCQVTVSEALDVFAKFATPSVDDTSTSADAGSVDVVSTDVTATDSTGDGLGAVTSADEPAASGGSPAGTSDVAADAGRLPGALTSSPEPGGVTSEGQPTTPTSGRDAGVVADASADAGAVVNPTDSGCDCRVAGSPAHGSTRFGALALAFGASAWLRRRAARQVGSRAV